MSRIVFINLEGRKAVTEIAFLNNLKAIILQNDHINNNIQKIDIISSNVNDVDRRGKHKISKIKKEKTNFCFFLFVDLDQKDKKDLENYCL